MEIMKTTPMQAAVDLYEAGVLDREEAEYLSGAKTKQEFAQVLVEGRRKRRAAAAHTSHQGRRHPSA
jgi:hypothetical protein